MKITKQSLVHQSIHIAITTASHTFVQPREMKYVSFQDLFLLLS